MYLVSPTPPNTATSGGTGFVPPACSSHATKPQLPSRIWPGFPHVSHERIDRESASAAAFARAFLISSDASGGSNVSIVKAPYRCRTSSSRNMDPSGRSDATSSKYRSSTPTHPSPHSNLAFAGIKAGYFCLSSSNVFNRFSSPRRSRLLPYWFHDANPQHVAAMPSQPVVRTCGKWHWR